MFTSTCAHAFFVYAQRTMHYVFKWVRFCVSVCIHTYVANSCCIYMHAGKTYKSIYKNFSMFDACLHSLKHRCYKIPKQTIFCGCLDVLTYT